MKIADEVNSAYAEKAAKLMYFTERPSESTKKSSTGVSSLHAAVALLATSRALAWASAEAKP